MLNDATQSYYVVLFFGAPYSGWLTTKYKQIPSPSFTDFNPDILQVLTGLGVDMTILPSGTSIEEVQQNLDLTKAAMRDPDIHVETIDI